MMGGRRQSVRLKTAHWLALAGVVAAICGAAAWQSRAQCTPEARLVFSPPGEAPWQWTLVPGRYRVRVTGKDLSAECTVDMPEPPVSCTGDRLWLLLNARGIVGLVVKDPPAHFTAAVHLNGTLVLSQQLDFAPHAERPCLLRELSLDLPATVRHGPRASSVVPSLPAQ